jgi:prophage DNA circulation protein
MATGILWLDQLRPASFRGMEFQVDSMEHSAGNNVVVREYPFQDLPTVFAMGKAAEEIKISGYVIGNDYTTQRDELREQLDVRGVGALVLPTVGTLMVSVAGKYTIKEAPTTEGGLARFDMTFVRSRPRRYPVAVENTAAQAEKKAELAKEATQDAFASNWSTADAPGWAADKAVARVKEATEKIWGAMGAATQQLGDFSNTIIGNYQALRDGLETLVRTPRLLAASIAQLYALPFDLSNAAARDLRNAFGSLFDAKALLTNTDFNVIIQPPPGGGLVMYGEGDASTLALPTPAREQLARLNLATDQFMESMAVSSWVQASSQADAGSYDETLALRAQAYAQITRLLTQASRQRAPMSLPQTAWHNAMLAMLSAYLADAQARGREGARLTTYTPQGWEPIWLVSYKLYGTVQFADEIKTLNAHITHPLLVPPGRALRVIKR